MTFKPLHLPDHLYFVTGSLVAWRPLFANHQYAHIILNSLDWHRQHNHFALYAYVVMPTHFHVLLKPLDNQTISSNLQSLASFTAHSILKQIRKDNLSDDIAVFAMQRSPDKTERHQIWQPLQAKNIFSREFLVEKAEYIHNNPIAKKWHLAESRTDYLYSSACFYDSGQEPIVAVEDLRNLL
jgi:REP element-mobilizing transposase RayT